MLTHAPPPGTLVRFSKRVHWFALVGDVGVAGWLARRRVLWVMLSDGQVFPVQFNRLEFVEEVTP